MNKPLKFIQADYLSQAAEEEHFFHDQENEDKDCPQCGGESIPLGTLGNTTHLRCRDCGWTFKA